MRKGIYMVLLLPGLVGSTVYGRMSTDTGSDDGLAAPSRHGERTGIVVADAPRNQLYQHPVTPVQAGSGASRGSAYPGDFRDPRAGWRGGDGHRDRNFRHDRVQTTFVFVSTAPFYYSDYYVNAPTVDQATDSYYQPGYQWGVALSQYSVTWDQLIAYLQDYILNASPTAQDAFRSGFIDGFGGSGPATFDHAMQVASSQ